MQRLQCFILALASLVVNSVYAGNLPPRYSAAVVGLAVANGATDVLTLKPSGSKKIRLKNIEVSGINSAGTSTVDLVLIKRSTLDVGGTSTVLTSIPHDSHYPAAEGIVTTWTANPSSLGTTTGKLRARKLTIAQQNQVNASNLPVLANFAQDDDTYVAQGTEEISLNWNGQTGASGAALDITVLWSEE